MVCKHYGKCGGCSFQDVPYQEQLNNKQQLTCELLGDYIDAEKVEQIEPSPEQWFYRNKMEYSFSRDIDSKQIVCGLHRKDVRRTIVDMQECPIFLKDIKKLTSVMTDYANKYELSFYSTYGHKGFLRYLVVRKSVAKKELLVNLVVSSQGELNNQELIETFCALELEYKVVSIYVTISDARADAVVPDSVKVIWGKDHIVETVYGLDFKVTPFTFFQVNPPALTKFYDTVLKIAGLKKTDTVLDVYCGVGTISSMLAPKCKFVWGIEFSEEAVVDAFENAKSNNLQNMSFIPGDARKVIQENMLNFKDNINLIVVNPPRSGMTPKTVKKVMALGAEKIIYSSCNVKTCRENIKQFKELYNLEYLKPFDFFPHTKHFEALILLVRKNRI